MWIVYKVSNVHLAFSANQPLKMAKLSVLIVTVLWVQNALCRRISDDLDNEILVNNNNLGLPSRRFHDWVKVTQPLTQIITRPVGARVELECEAMGSPPPVMQWLKGNTPLTENESFETNLINDKMFHGMAKAKSRLIINSALMIHEGTFTCLAESGSQIATSQTKLFVVRGGSPERNFSQLLEAEMLAARSPARITLYNSVYLDTIGSDVILPCKAVGNPLPDIIWLDLFQRVIDGVSDERFSILPDGLRIKGIRWDDMGAYTCVARNTVAEDSIITFLYPLRGEK